MNIAPISFKSRKISSFTYKNEKTHKEDTLNFVQYDYKKDDLIKLTEAVKPKDDSFLGDRILKTFKNIYTGQDTEPNDKRFYGIENSKGEIQALCKTDTEFPYLSCMLNEDGKIYSITLLVTLPKNRYGAEDREYKGLGAKMTSEVIKQAKNENAQKIGLICSNPSFWDKIPYFKSAGDGAFRILEKKDYDNCTKSLDLNA